MPTPHKKRNMVFHNTVKHCLCCQKLLILNNVRDIERKKYCSRSCCAKHMQQQGRLSKPPKSTEESYRKARQSGFGGVGEKNPRWIKNRSKLKYHGKNARHRDSFEIKNWRNSIFVRDNYTCRICGIRGHKSNVHHVLGYNDSPEYRYSIWNGITLCELCHKKYHKLYGYYNHTLSQFINYVNAVETYGGGTNYASAC